MAASHSFSVLSSLPDSTRVPSGENATEVTQSECPSKVRTRAPVAASHSFSVLSELPDSTRVPSGENATEMTASECPSKVRTRAPVAASHSFSVLSLAARQHAGAIGRERNRKDPVRMPLKGAHEGSGGRVPQLQRLVPAA